MSNITLYTLTTMSYIITRDLIDGQSVKKIFGCNLIQTLRFILLCSCSDMPEQINNSYRIIDKKGSLALLVIPSTLWFILQPTPQKCWIFTIYLHSSRYYYCFLFLFGKYLPAIGLQLRCIHHSCSCYYIATIFFFYF